MLCITRKVNQRLTITTDAGVVIVIAVHCADRGVCELGIEAPRSFAILRDDAHVHEPKPRRLR